jgi:hypothetical protein
MVTEIKEYESFKQMAEKIDENTAETKSKLGNYLLKLDQVRASAEKSRKIRQAVMKLDAKTNSAEPENEVALEGLRIVLDANSTHEQTVMEIAAQSLQEHLLGLQKSREALKCFDSIDDSTGLNYLVIQNEGIPECILLRNPKIGKTAPPTKPNIQTKAKVEPKA